MTKIFTFFISLFTVSALTSATSFAADPINISCPGGVCNNQTIDNKGEMIVNDKGIATNNTINDTGKISINQGGQAIGTTVNVGGNMFVYEGGSADTTLVEGGLVNTVAGGEITNTTINSGSVVNQGEASGTIVNSSGGQITGSSYEGFEVSGTGTAENTTVNTGGTMLVSDGGSIEDTSVEGGLLMIDKDGTATDTTINTGVVTSQGNTSNTIVNSSGAVIDGDTHQGFEVSGTGVADKTTVNTGGTMLVYDGGTASGTIINGGVVEVRYDQTTTTTPPTTSGDDAEEQAPTSSSVSNTTINSGTLNVETGGMADSTIINQSGVMNINEGGSASNTLIKNGTLNVNDGGIASQTTLDGGTMNISGSGTAGSSTVNNLGNIIAKDTASVSSTTINSGGTLTLEDSANASGIHVNDGGTFDATQTDGVISGLSVNGTGSYHLTTDSTVTNANLYGQHYDSLFKNGVGDGVIIGGSSTLEALNGAKLYNTVLQSNGALTVQDGALISNTTANGSSTISIATDASATDTILNGNSSMNVEGTVVGTIVNSSGQEIAPSTVVEGLIIENGAQAFNSTVNSKGTMLVKDGGSASDTIVNGGSFTAQTNSDLNNLVVLGQSNLDLSDGANLTGDITISKNSTLGGTYNYDNIFDDVNISSLVVVNGINEKFNNQLEATVAGKSLSLDGGNYNISSDGANGSTLVSGWDSITIGGAYGSANVSLAGDLNMDDADKTIKINSGSVLDTSAVENINILGSIVNAGDLNLISPGNLVDDLDNTTTIAGDYTGVEKASISLKVDTLNNKADKLVINGDVSGTSTLNVNLTSFNKPTEKILFLEAPNDDLSTASNFTIWRVNSSPYQWDTSHEGNNWYMEMANLNGKVGVYSETLAYMGLPHAALEQTKSVVYNVINKVNLRNNNLVDNRVMHSPAYRYYSKGIENFYNNYNFWAMPIYHSVSNENSVNFDADIVGGEAGIDIYNDTNNRIGAFISYRQGEYEFEKETDRFFARYSNEIDIDSYLAGVFYRHNWQNTWALATIYGGIQDADIQTKDDVKSSTDGTEFGLSVAGGYIYNVNYSFNIEPSAIFNITSISYDDAKDIYGKSAEFSTITSLEADLGVKFEQTWNLDSGFAKAYIRPSILFNSVSGGEVEITNLFEKTPEIDDGAFARLEIGGSADLSKFFSLYATARATAGNDYQDVAITAGLNYVF